MTTDRERVEELEAAVEVLAETIHAIEEVASDYMDLGRQDLSTILNLIQRVKVRAAMEGTVPSHAITEALPADPFEGLVP